MRESLIKAGVVIVKTGGASIEVRDFAPFLMTTSKLLDRISNDDGITIPPESLVARVIGIPLFTIEKRIGFVLRIAIESSESVEHAIALERVRFAEIQSLFDQLMVTPQEQIDTMLARPEFTKATRLLLDIVSSANTFFRHGETVRQCTEYDMHIVLLHDSGRSGEPDRGGVIC